MGVSRGSRRVSPWREDCGIGRNRASRRGGGRAGQQDGDRGLLGGLGEHLEAARVRKGKGALGKASGPAAGQREEDLRGGRGGE